MRGIRPGEIWIVDFGLAAKVRPALLLTGDPADELVTCHLSPVTWRRLTGTVAR